MTIIAQCIFDADNEKPQIFVDYYNIYDVAVIE